MGSTSLLANTGKASTFHNEKRKIKREAAIMAVLAGEGEEPVTTIVKKVAFFTYSRLMAPRLGWPYGLVA
jgi:ribosomal protein L25 (general stress protein Ctc)